MPLGLPCGGSKVKSRRHHKGLAASVKLHLLFCEFISGHILPIKALQLWMQACSQCCKLERPVVILPTPTPWMVFFEEINRAPGSIRWVDAKRTRNNCDYHMCMVRNKRASRSQHAVGRNETNNYGNPLKIGKTEVIGLAPSQK